MVPSDGRRKRELRWPAFVLEAAANEDKDMTDAERIGLVKARLQALKKKRDALRSQLISAERNIKDYETFLAVWQTTEAGASDPKSTEPEDDKSVESVFLADFIREILIASPRPMSAREIADSVWRTDYHYTRKDVPLHKAVAHELQRQDKMRKQGRVNKGIKRVARGRYTVIRESVVELK